jgi:glyoxylase-like metal-dependent hydrolase (beta-lactamase superfamily II)
MKVQIIAAGRFKLDGGAMFGVVPKRMWEKMNPPDSNNLCTWNLNTLLVDTGDRRILFDTGIGNKQDDRFRSHFEPQGEEELFTSLSAAGYSRNDITDVFLTHLHFDHCGGALWKNEHTGSPEPAFPKAIYWTNRRHLDWALRPNDREKASFLKENFLPLLEAGRLHFVDVQQGREWLPGIRIRLVSGHTEAMMLPEIKMEQQTLVYCADLIPSQWHVGMPYVMAYDIRPLLSLREKAALLRQAVRRRLVLVLEHDPLAQAVTVREDEKGRIVADQTGALADLLH